MNRKWLGIAALIVAATVLLSLSSCARNQQLVGITVQPRSFTFLTPTATVSANFTAMGTYIHPAENKDITALVSWNVDVTKLVSIASGVVTTSGQGTCGIANISASYNHGTGPSGNVVTGYATVTVNDPLISYCPGGAAAPILSVVPESTNSSGNSVTSSPVGIDCPATTCGAPFAAGTAVTLTATPSANFVSWGTTCPGASANVCVVDVTANTAVTAIFK